MIDNLFLWLGIAVVASPSVLLAVLGLTTLLGRPLRQNRLPRD
ncbi:MAG: hypothetical protein R3C56_18640 [Pirellulaceae bacterium]